MLLFVRFFGCPMTGAVMVIIVYLRTCRGAASSLQTCSLASKCMRYGDLSVPQHCAIAKSSGTLTNMGGRELALFPCLEREPVSSGQTPVPLASAVHATQRFCYMIGRRFRATTIAMARTFPSRPSGSSFLDDPAHPACRLHSYHRFLHSPGRTFLVMPGRHFVHPSLHQHAMRRRLRNCLSAGTPRLVTLAASRQADVASQRRPPGQSDGQLSKRVTCNAWPQVGSRLLRTTFANQRHRARASHSVLLSALARAAGLSLTNSSSHFQSPRHPHPPTLFFVRLLSIATDWHPRPRRFRLLPRPRPVSSPSGHLCGHRQALHHPTHPLMLLRYAPTSHHRRIGLVSCSGMAA